MCSVLIPWSTSHGYHSIQSIELLNIWGTAELWQISVDSTLKGWVCNQINGFDVCVDLRGAPLIMWTPSTNELVCNWVWFFLKSQHANFGVCQHILIFTINKCGSFTWDYHNSSFVAKAYDIISSLSRSKTITTKIFSIT